MISPLDSLLEYVCSLGPILIQLKLADVTNIAGSYGVIRLTALLITLSFTFTAILNMNVQLKQDE